MKRLLVVMGTVWVFWATGCWRHVDVEPADGDGGAGLEVNSEAAKPSDEQLRDTDSHTAASPPVDSEPLTPSYCQGRESGETELITTLYDTSSRIAMDAESIYVVGRNEEVRVDNVWQIHKDDGQQHGLVPSNNSDPSHLRDGVLALDDTYVYVADGDKDGDLARIPKSGGEPELFSAEGGLIRNIAVDGALFCFTVDSPPWPSTRDLWCGATDAWPQAALFVGEIATFDIEENVIYFAKDGTLWRQPAAESAPEVLGEQVTDADDIGYDIFLATGGNLYLYGDYYGLFRVDAKNGAVELLWENIGGDDLLGFDVDGDDAYWTLDTGELWHGSLSAPSETEVLDQHGPYDDEDFYPSVAIDGDAVFWTAAPDDSPSGYDEGPFNLYRTCR